jgi:hypothetical protein
LPILFVHSSLPLASGVQRKYFTRLLTDQQHIAAFEQRHQQGRRADVEIGSVLRGAIGAAADEADEVPGVALS